MQLEKLYSRKEKVMQRFGLTSERRPGWNEWKARLEIVAEQIADVMSPKRIVLLRGASGSGKSVLLSQLRRKIADMSDVGDQPIGDAAAVDHLYWMDLESALELLGRFGLGEVYTYLSPASQLSTGQQFRLRLAMAFGRRQSRGGATVLADEFATQLDQVSAAIIASNTRRVVDALGVCLVAVSCHQELAEPLAPDVVVDCDFGEYEISRGAA